MNPFSNQISSQNTSNTLISIPSPDNSITMDSKDFAIAIVNMNLEIRVFKKTIGKHILIINQKITYLSFQKG